MLAGGPAAKTRSTRAGRETRRRAASTTLRSSAAWPNRGPTAATMLAALPNSRVRRSIMSAVSVLVVTRSARGPARYEAESHRTVIQCFMPSRFGVLHMPGDFTSRGSACCTCQVILHRAVRRAAHAGCFYIAWFGVLHMAGDFTSRDPACGTCRVLLHRPVQVAASAGRLWRLYFSPSVDAPRAQASMRRSAPNVERSNTTALMMA